MTQGKVKMTNGRWTIEMKGKELAQFLEIGVLK